MFAQTIRQYAVIYKLTVLTITADASSHFSDLQMEHCQLKCDAIASFCVVEK